jgi:dihydrofolate synthase/folylpolyglutamate synthase
MSAAELGEMTVDIYGPDRVRIEPALPDAIEAAVTLAESDVELGLGGVGIVVTGSVMTVADARKLLVR